MVADHPDRAHEHGVLLARRAPVRARQATHDRGAAPAPDRFRPRAGVHFGRTAAGDPLDQTARRRRARAAVLPGRSRLRTHLRAAGLTGFGLFRR